jgi:hypothetical protein
MSVSFRCVLLLSISLLMVTGCNRGGASDFDLYPAQGTVTYKNAPLAGATVVFVPDSGPTASGMTDSSGVFKLSSGGRPGAAVGKSKVTVTKGDPNAASKAAGQMKPEDMMKVQKGEVAAPETKSGVPAAYGSPSTTPLDATVLPDGNKNKFQFDLVD